MAQPYEDFLLFIVLMGTLITEKERILEYWAEHFQSVLNIQSVINDQASYPSALGPNQQLPG